MSYFKNLSDAAVSTAFNFQAPAVGVQNFIRCIDGELAGWEYWKTDDDGNVLVKLYDKTTGETIQKATVYICTGRDIFNGLFSTGVFPSADIFDPACIFYRVDYL